MGEPLEVLVFRMLNGRDENAVAELHNRLLSGGPPLAEFCELMQIDPSLRRIGLILLARLLSIGLPDIEVLPSLSRLLGPTNPGIVQVALELFATHSRGSPARHEFLESLAVADCIGLSIQEQNGADRRAFQEVVAAAILNEALALPHRIAYARIAVQWSEDCSSVLCTMIQSAEPAAQKAAIVTVLLAGDAIIPPEFQTGLIAILHEMCQLYLETWDPSWRVSLGAILRQIDFTPAVDSSPAELLPVLRGLLAPSPYERDSWQETLDSFIPYLIDYGEYEEEDEADENECDLATDALIVISQSDGLRQAFFEFVDTAGEIGLPDARILNFLNEERPELYAALERQSDDPLWTYYTRGYLMEQQRATPDNIFMGLLEDESPISWLVAIALIWHSDEDGAPSPRVLQVAFMRSTECLSRPFATGIVIELLAPVRSIVTLLIRTDEGRATVLPFASEAVASLLGLMRETHPFFAFQLEMSKLISLFLSYDEFALHVLNAAISLIAGGLEGESLRLAVLLGKQILCTPVIFKYLSEQDHAQLCGQLLWRSQLTEPELLPEVCEIALDLVCRDAPGPFCDLCIAMIRAFGDALPPSFHSFALALMLRDTATCPTILAAIGEFHPDSVPILTACLVLANIDVDLHLIEEVAVAFAQSQHALRHWLLEDRIMLAFLFRVLAVIPILADRIGAMAMNLLGSLIASQEEPFGAVDLRSTQFNRFTHICAAFRWVLDDVSDFLRPLLDTSDQTFASATKEFAVIQG
jgi:hypothetical protein